MRTKSSYHAYRRGNQRKLTPLQKKEVKSLITRVEEVKAIDSAFLQTVDAAGIIQKISLPPQGANVSQRDGDRITLKHLRVRLNITCADATNVVRLILFRWQNNDNVSVPVVGDILQTLNAMAQDQFTSQRQHEFHIIADKTLAFTLAGEADKTWIMTYYGRKLGKKHIDFNASLLTGTDCIYLLTLSDSVAAPHPGCAGTMRLEYTDS